MVDVLTEIVINRPISEVFEYSTKTENVCKWYDNINSAEMITEGEIGLGTKIAFNAVFMKKNMSYVYEIVEYEAMSIFTMETEQGPFPMKTTYSYISLDENTTKITLRNSGIPSGFSILMAPFIKLMMKKANNKDLIKLKSILEGNSSY